MQAVTDALAEVRLRLGPAVVEALSSIGDDVLLERAARGLSSLAGALEALDAFVLGPHEFEEQESPANEPGLWSVLAPGVRALFEAVQRTLGELEELFPAPPEGPATEPLELEGMFDELEDGPAPSPIRDRRDEQLDGIVEQSVDRHEELTSVIGRLTGLLRGDLANFGMRLRNPRLLGERWLLIGELEEMKTKYTQGLEAILAAILAAFTRAPVESLVPRYGNATQRAVRLRTLLVDLAEDATQLLQALDEATLEQAGLVVLSWAHRLDTFMRAPAYAELRPLDKREVLLFRQKLVRRGAKVVSRGVPWNIAPPALSQAQLRDLRRDADGFVRFLELLRSINRREVLHRHDRQRLEAARTLLDSDADFERILVELEPAYGRAPSLDGLLRAARFGEPVASAALREAVDEAAELLAAMSQ